MFFNISGSCDLDLQPYDLKKILDLPLLVGDPYVKYRRFGMKIFLKDLILGGAIKPRNLENIGHSDLISGFQGDLFTTSKTA